ncbi:hypothetical protein WJX72_005489 [[Myrmecia] bisecta]|uniref:Uncharacterized protein n=1 Tax=[Myrmecia] bisecta TaxID=41462 RepID=A0AAW1R5V4_9CHLO
MFILNHHDTLGNYCDHVELELLRPGDTYAWKRCYAKNNKYQKVADKVEKRVQSKKWWKKVSLLVDISSNADGEAICSPEPLRMADSNQPVIGKIYHGCFMLQEHIDNLTGLSDEQRKEPRDIIVDRCERNWSTYDFMHSKRRIRLKAKRAEKLVYVHSNLRLIDSTQQLDYEESDPAWQSDASDSSDE